MTKQQKAADFINNHQALIKCRKSGTIWMVGFSFGIFPRYDNGFTFEELIRLAQSLGFEEKENGSD